MAKRVLIIGGYGTFGRQIARALASEPGFQLIIAGRSLAKANQLAAELAPANPTEVLSLDIAEGIDRKIAPASPDIVVHTAGPFQTQSYEIAEACLNHGCHYIDLADARQFVAGIARYDAAARAKNLLLVSGASSVPCLTAAVIEHHRPHFLRLDTVEYGISAAQMPGRGLATTTAVLRCVGKPFTTKVRGRPATVFGWQDLHAEKYPEHGWRLFGNCDVPDLELFPSRFAEIETIRVAAGLEVKALHLGLWGLSWLVRLRLIGSLGRAAPYLLAIAGWFDLFGSGRGGFHMMLSGIGMDGKPLSEWFFLIARSGHGSFIPTVPAILLARGLASGETTARGALPCLGLIGLEAYLAALEGLDISVVKEVRDG